MPKIPKRKPRPGKGLATPKRANTPAKTKLATLLERNKNARKLGWIAGHKAEVAKLKAERKQAKLDRLVKLPRIRRYPKQETVIKYGKLGGKRKQLAQVRQLESGILPPFAYKRTFTDFLDYGIKKFTYVWHFRGVDKQDAVDALLLELDQLQLIDEGLKARVNLTVGTPIADSKGFDSTSKSTAINIPRVTMSAFKKLMSQRYVQDHLEVNEAELVTFDVYAMTPSRIIDVNTTKPKRIRRPKTSVSKNKSTRSRNPTSRKGHGKSKTASKRSKNASKVRS